MNPFLLLLKLLEHWILPFGLVCIQFGAHQQITDDSAFNYIMSYVSFYKYEQFLNEIFKRHIIIRTKMEVATLCLLLHLKKKKSSNRPGKALINQRLSKLVDKKIKCSFKAMPVGIKFTDLRWTPDEMAKILVR